MNHRTGCSGSPCTCGLAPSKAERLAAFIRENGITENDIRLARDSLARQGREKLVRDLRRALETAQVTMKRLRDVEKDFPGDMLEGPQFITDLAYLTDRLHVNEDAVEHYLAGPE